MTITDIILKKRNNGILNKNEIEYFVNGYTKDEIPDYQISALLMAIWFRGMNEQETTDLTIAMAESGDQIDLSAIEGIKVDKHSTGGVADTTTLVAAPLVAACGGKVAKMSGRGLGHTGGTIDKLESIPGLSINQTMETFQDIVSRFGISVIGQTASLVPADKKLYALRDVTGTVDNMSLIASSIMSKKLASGSDAIVLDVKTGSGAFMKQQKDAESLAKAMVNIGNLAGRKTVALVTDMNQPLGMAIGNAIEVKEAIEILQGQHPGDLKDVSMALAAQMLLVSDVCKTREEAFNKIEEAITNRSALKSLADMIHAQGGNSEVVNNPGLLPTAETIMEVKADSEGYLSHIETDEIGMAALLLGAGRETKEDIIDPAVGIWMKVRLGDRISKGQVLALFHVNKKDHLDESVRRFMGAITLSESKSSEKTLIYKHFS